MTSIIDGLKKRQEHELEYVKAASEEMENSMKWFNREARFEKLDIAYELLDSHLGTSKPDAFLLDLYDSDIRFRVVFDKLFSIHRDASKRILKHKLSLLIKYPVETTYYTENESFAISLLDDYKMVYGAPMHKEVFTNDMKEFFNIQRVKKWLN